MFDRFRGFFLVLFQAHVLFYLLPLYWRFRCVCGVRCGRW